MFLQIILVAAICRGVRNSRAVWRDDFAKNVEELTRINKRAFSKSV